jgi:hypothetical protein
MGAKMLGKKLKAQSMRLMQQLAKLCDIDFYDLLH